MSAAAERLEHTKALRNAARAEFDQRLAQVKHYLDVRGIGGRIADRVGEDATAVMEEAQKIASEHRGLIAGTIAALTLWFLRNPLMKLANSLLGKTLEAVKHYKEKD
jgi:hypothetical protein